MVPKGVELRCASRFLLLTSCWWKRGENGCEHVVPDILIAGKCTHVIHQSAERCNQRQRVALKKAKSAVKENSQVTGKGSEIITQFYTLLLPGCTKVWGRWWGVIISLVLHSKNSHLVRYGKAGGWVELWHHKRERKEVYNFGGKPLVRQIAKQDWGLVIINPFIQLEGKQPG